ncbi:Kelch-like protein terF [Lachnellula suecica]|uniref:Kelch-like protein terF n=1 Tax=Lachnellula suecica TaxID=602035 RepID=A0A8T9BXL6_9HELO|nr:Kelch-like protein terF [Lachnellula suecica]
MLNILSTFVLLTQLVSSISIPPRDTNVSTGSGTWKSFAPIPINPRQEHGAVKFDNDTLYIIGGIIASPFPTVTTVQKYTISTDTWTTVADLPIPLNHPNSAVVNGKIYVLGGLSTIDNPDLPFWNATGDCFEYDPTPNTWTTIAQLPEGRQIGSAAVGVKGNTIYLAGGIVNTNLTDDEEGTVSVFTSYNVKTKKFKFLADLPEPRDHAGVGLIKGRLYVLGGRAYGHNNTKDTVFAYDIKNNSWTTGLAKMPTARGSLSSGVIGTKIFTIGGEGDPNTTSGVYPQVQAYDTGKDIWTLYPDMDVPRHGTAGVVFGNKIYIPGGGLTTGGDPTNYTSYFQPS